ncbi:hypothetical protein [Luteimonas wenzhouensis]|uniref:Uncharacterized protein n=1 Tax=Luteimonas wenzhouensis TaxID=2599615 RepID=A0A5C5U6S9_9GAMM|nr:hypothetical protein [Luteimonas wenzhouensis]NLW98023.1 hypothetical protein [Xanthomonadaceae bacterium]TWT21576.1 hypothetical protein FQY79_00070 [Luteimonas wenzhouensis]
MSTPKPGTAGATRTCPHCKTTILASAAICPSCRHYLRFDSPRAEPGAAPAESTTALQVEGMIRHPAEGGAWEYSVLLTVRDDEGNELARHVVGVGAMHAGEERTFHLSVEVTPTNDTRRPPRAPRRVFSKH